MLALAALAGILAALLGLPLSVPLTIACVSLVCAHVNRQWEDHDA